MKTFLQIAVAITLLCSLPVTPSRAEEPAYGTNDEIAASPKAPWGDFTPTEQKDSNTAWWEPVLFYIPNRIFDFIDIFRADVGVGPSFGAVVRLSKVGQVGYRSISPFSARIGDFGRQAPYLLETSSEFGVGPGYVSSKDRKVCTGELGLGLDLFLVGAYGGICVEELLDFGAGIFLLDTQDDDYVLNR